MIVLAVRCSNTDFAYAVVEGTKETPILLHSNITAFPKGYEEHSLFHWFYQEMLELFSTHKPNILAVKAAESMVRRSANLELRIRAEGIALMSAAEVGCSAVFRKVKPTIAKDLGMKGKGKYLETKLDTSPILDFDSYKTKQQEAILVGWSCLE